MYQQQAEAYLTSNYPMFSSSTIETIDGWVPQIRVNGVIVWEGKTAYESGNDALAKSNKRISKRLTELFA